jgi:hypothetical protein
MAPNKARIRLRAVIIDNEFYKNGIHIYLKLIGYENENEWLHDQIASRIHGSNEADY